MARSRHTSNTCSVNEYIVVFARPPFSRFLCFAIIKILNQDNGTEKLTKNKPAEQILLWICKLRSLLVSLLNLCPSAFTHAPSPPHPETSPIHLTFGVTPGIHTYLLGKSLLLTQAVRMPSLPRCSSTKCMKVVDAHSVPLAQRRTLVSPVDGFWKSIETVNFCRVAC